ncbi:MAG: NADPH-dependent FMN reductase, partial [Hyphomicrobiales bacterium]|nr:NADPH-dependent FMN reductase [Hyphomicrobiales bacterium]
RGWDYPRHLAGRLYSVVAHGDAEGAEGVRRSLSDWLTAMHLVSAGRLAELDRYIGYYEPYALNHEELDSDEAIKTEVRNAARTLLEAVLAKKAGKMIEAGKDLREAREK